VFPATPQAANVNDEKVTGSPDDAVAFTVKGLALSARLINEPNVIVWLDSTGATVKLWSTSGAAA
jgi:hypothetical protein